MSITFRSSSCSHESSIPQHPLGESVLNAEVCKSMKKEGIDLDVTKYPIRMVESYAQKLINEGWAVTIRPVQTWLPWDTPPTGVDDALSREGSPGRPGPILSILVIRP